jgi:hypothetical protein
MLIEKLKEKLREITEPSLKLNAIKAYLSKHLESFVEAMIVTGASNAMRKRLMKLISIIQTAISSRLALSLKKMWGLRNEIFY